MIIPCLPLFVKPLQAFFDGWFDLVVYFVPSSPNFFRSLAALGVQN